MISLIFNRATNAGQMWGKKEHSPFLFNIVIVFLTRAIKQERNKNNNKYQGRSQIIPDDVILCLKYSKHSTKKLRSNKYF
jgi:hypothetical protein